MIRSFGIALLNQSGYVIYSLCSAAVLSVLLCMAKPGYGELCRSWDEGKKTGELSLTSIKEASGIAVSRKYPGRLYHVNDSGGGPYFYLTDMKGAGTQRVKIEGLIYDRSSDYEDLGLGRCGLNKSCLFIADIGDNREKREYARLILVEEKEDYASSVTPVSVIKLVYPDRAHNAEGLAVHPNGDVYVLTKEENLDKLEAYPSRLS